MSPACSAWHGRSASWRSASRTSTAVMPTSSRRSRSVSVSSRPGRGVPPASGCARRDRRPGGGVARSHAPGRADPRAVVGKLGQAVVSAAAVDGLRNVEVVPLVGGLATDGSLVASQELVRELAVRLGRRTDACTDRPCCTPTPRGTRCLPNRLSEESSRGLGPPTSPWSRSARSTQNRLAGV